MVVAAVVGGFVVVLAGARVLGTMTSSEESESLDSDSFDSEFESFSSELDLDCTDSDESDPLRKGNRRFKESFSSELDPDCTESDESDSLRKGNCRLKRKKYNY